MTLLLRSWAQRHGRGTIHQHPEERTMDFGRRHQLQSGRVARAIVFAVLLVLPSCRTIELAPAPSANEVAGRRNAAEAKMEGVHMVAQAARWPGPVAISDDVMPLYVEIDNRGESPLRVRYSEFSLVSGGGHRFAALPPLAVEGEGRLKSFGPFRHPGYIYRDFALAPWYAPIFPGYPVYDRHPFAVDPFYYDTYYPYWDTRPELPTPAMIDWALPEGVVMPGGLVQGWLYFEELDPDVERVALRTDLVDAANGVGYGELRIPFIVK